MPPTAPDGPTDAELARRVVAGGADAVAALNELVARYNTRLVALLRREFRDKAEDIAQEAWLKAIQWLATPGVQAMTNFRAWLFEVAQNRGRDMRAKKYPVPLPADVEPAEDHSPLAGFIDAEERAVAQGCWEILPADLQEAVVACTGGEEKPAALAERLNVTVTTIYTRKLRGLLALKACVEKH